MGAKNLDFAPMFPQHVVFGPKFCTSERLFCDKRFSNNFQTAQNLGRGAIALLPGHDPNAHIRVHKV